MEKVVEIYRKEEGLIAVKEELSTEVLEAQVELERLRETKERAERLKYWGQVRAIDNIESRLLAKVARAKIRDIPYPKLILKQWEILRQYFNRDTDISKYGMDVIPPLVLREVEEAHKLGVFDRITVYYHQDPKKDPLICGCVNEGDDVGDVPRLIARFGDALQPWEWFQEYCYKRTANIVGAVFMGVLTWAVIFTFSIVAMADTPSVSGKLLIQCLVLSVTSGALSGTLFQYISNWRRRKKIFSIPSPFLN